MLKVVKGIDDAIELREWLYRQPDVAIDTETTGLDVFSPGFKVRVTQFGNATESWILPTEGWEGFLDTLIGGYSGRIIMHNSRYDVLALGVRGVTVPWEQIDDTMIALRLAAPHESAALKVAASKYVSSKAAGSQADLAKAMRTNGWGWDTVPIDFERYLFYAAMDTIITYRLAKTAVCAKGFGEPLYALEMDLRALCTSMERNGMRVDVDFCERTHADLLGEQRALIDSIQDSHGFAVGSTSQLSRWLMERGVKIRKRTPSGSPSVDMESLEMILADGQTEDVAHVVRSAKRVRDLTKLTGNYFENFLDFQTDGLLHPSIETLAAKTGRMSIRAPALQTLPRGDSPDAKLVRSAVIPRAEGEVLVSCDYEQIELRLIAAESKDPELIDAFARADSGTGMDFFTESMRAVYSDPSLPKSDTRRTLIKTLFYASSYGAGISKMASQAGVPEPEMRDVSERVFARYPGIKRLMQSCAREAETNDGWVKTAMGRSIWVDPEMSYKALNAKIQGLAADLFKTAAVNLGHAGLTDYLVAPVHDEMLFSLPEDIYEEAAPIIQETMSSEWNGVQLPAAPSEGYKSWGSIPK